MENSLVMSLRLRIVNLVIGYTIYINTACIIQNLMAAYAAGSI